jgi:hypothetical protein
MSDSTLQVTGAQVAAFRLARNHLLDRRPATLAAVCRDVCGIQAQVMSAAEMSLAARVSGLKREAVHAALWKARALVKTSAMRGTLHLLAAEDFPIYMQALKESRLRHLHRVMGKYGGISPQLSADVSDAAVEALSRGPMTPGELKRSVLAQGLARGRAKKFFAMAWWGVVRQAMIEGRVCYGPNRGHDVMLVRAQDWLPRPPARRQRGVPRAMTESQAKVILLRRYLRAYGPATPQDFCRWSGMFGAEARPVWERLSRELREVNVEGRRAWLLARDLRALLRSRLEAPHLRLLPNFDSYLLAHNEKDHLVDARHYAQVYRQAAWISPVVLWNGRAVGIWSLDAESKELRVRLFSKATREITAGLKAEASRLSKFLQRPCRLML